MAERYSNREIDALATKLGDKIDNFKNVLELKMSDNHKAAADSLSRIEMQVGYTNGKVKKITLALVLLGGVCIGLGFQQVSPFLGLIL
jgi:hypothetical protein